MPVTVRKLINCLKPPKEASQKKKIIRTIIYLLYIYILYIHDSSCLFCQITSFDVFHDHQSLTDPTSQPRSAEVGPACGSQASESFSHWSAGLKFSWLSEN